MKRRGRRIVFVVAIGVRSDGGFEVLDWEVSSAEGSGAYERLFDRLWRRGLREVDLIVGDEASGIWEARDVVYPYSRSQVCLWHLQRTLERHLRAKGFWARTRLRREYWRVFDVEEKEEGLKRFEDFCSRWAEGEPEMVEAFRARKGKVFAYLDLPYWWRHRVRTTNLGENFFRHLRVFLRRFPGLMDEMHADLVMATYLLSLEEKGNTGKLTPYQLQLSFNTGC